MGAAQTINETITAKQFIENHPSKEVRGMVLVLVAAGQNIDKTALLNALGANGEVKVDECGNFYVGDLSEELKDDGFEILTKLETGIKNMTGTDTVEQICNNRVKYDDDFCKMGYNVAVTSKKEYSDTIKGNLATVDEAQEFSKSLLDILVTQVGMEPRVASATVVERVVGHLNVVAKFTADLHATAVQKEFKVVFGKASGNGMTLDVHTFEFATSAQTKVNKGWWRTSTEIFHSYKLDCKTAALMIKPKRVRATD